MQTTPTAQPKYPRDLEEWYPLTAAAVFARVLALGNPGYNDGKPTRFDLLVAELAPRLHLQAVRLAGDLDDLARYLWDLQVPDSPDLANESRLAAYAFWCIITKNLRPKQDNQHQIREYSNIYFKPTQNAVETALKEALLAAATATWSAGPIEIVRASWGALKTSLLDVGAVQEHGSLIMRGYVPKDAPPPPEPAAEQAG